LALIAFFEHISFFVLQKVIRIQKLHFPVTVHCKVADILWHRGRDLYMGEEKRELANKLPACPL
jgi:hypothetical protein